MQYIQKFPFSLSPETKMSKTIASVVVAAAIFGAGYYLRRIRGRRSVAVSKSRVDQPNQVLPSTLPESPLSDDELESMIRLSPKV